MEKRTIFPFQMINAANRFTYHFSDCFLRNRTHTQHLGIILIIFYVSSSAHLWWSTRPESRLWQFSVVFILSLSKLKWLMMIFFSFHSTLLCLVRLSALDSNSKKLIFASKKSISTLSAEVFYSSVNLLNLIFYRCFCCLNFNLIPRLLIRQNSKQTSLRHIWNPIVISHVLDYVTFDLFPHACTLRTVGNPKLLFLNRSYTLWVEIEFCHLSKSFLYRDNTKNITICLMFRSLNALEVNFTMNS